MSRDVRRRTAPWCDFVDRPGLAGTHATRERNLSPRKFALSQRAELAQQKAVPGRTRRTRAAPGRTLAFRGENRGRAIKFPCCGGTLHAGLTRTLLFFESNESGFSANKQLGLDESYKIALKNRS